jgi:hypothetical protein
LGHQHVGIASKHLLWPNVGSPTCWHCNSIFTLAQRWVANMLAVQLNIYIGPTLGRQHVGIASKHLHWPNVGSPTCWHCNSTFTLAQRWVADMLAVQLNIYVGPTLGHQHVGIVTQHLHWPNVGSPTCWRCNSTFTLAQRWVANRLALQLNIYIGPTLGRQHVGIATKHLHWPNVGSPTCWNCN